MTEILLQLVLAFTCSIGFGMVFGIAPKHLPVAGLAGFVVKIVVLITMHFTSQRFLYSLAGAIMAALFAEIVGRIFDTAHSKYLYPALVPLIPGDVLYKLLLESLRLHGANAGANGLELCAGLFGIAIGCMIVPTLIHTKKLIIG